MTEQGDWNNNLAGGLHALGVAGADVKAELMLAYMRLVLERNEVVNLTAIKGEGEFVAKHLIDSVSCFGLPEIEAAQSVVDVGAGAGFPGVPLAICYPDKDFLLIDSLGKRVDFMREACGALGIENVRVMHSRAEDAGHDPALRENFGLAVSRAVAHLSVLCEYCLPLVKTGGAFYAYKTENGLGEVGESKRARKLLGAAANPEIHNTSGAGAQNSGHIIIAIGKERKTPAAYPRKAGTPAKQPL
ncbi:MAG: 16S rRNA (guanine(527)-N(7))-methyltransferase RsmG [Clostridiales Family XIII bacterium]|jgi:16S rRNA (guanine527-N7)-methyltransferase|nr:16S rRNA (guanine(527)-N(7))-methyltransferase RsmG [Clostridiales Family XIII bacterium]